MNQQHLPLAQHFGYGRLLRYTFPAIVMMVITSVYTVVDGFFCLQLCRKNILCCR